MRALESDPLYHRRAMLSLHPRELDTRGPLVDKGWQGGDRPKASVSAPPDSPSLTPLNIHLCVSSWGSRRLVLCGTLVPEQVVREKAVLRRKDRDSRDSSEWKERGPPGPARGMIAATDSHDQDREPKRRNARKNTVGNRGGAVCSTLCRALGPSSS